MDFKIIAIRPLEYCNSNFLKNLQKNELYYFYNDYKIERFPDKSEVITYSEKVPSSFYNIKREHTNDLSVNISAIVGKNGSGKSSIIELLFRAINNIACKVKNRDNEINTITAKLQNIKGINIEFYIHTNSYYKVYVNYKTISIYKFDNNNLSKDAKEENIDLEKLFYTEAVNYSHYAYNTAEFGPWLKELFHKNDSYQTPIVLNPMRTDGDININTENELIKQRLIVNLIRASKKDQHFLTFGDNLIATHLKFRLKENKKKVTWYEPKATAKFIERTIKLHNFRTKKNALLKSVMFLIADIKNFDHHFIEREIYNSLADYIIYKMISISLKYTEYKKYRSLFLIKYNEALDIKLFDKFLIDLKSDESHIVFKLNQSINYLKCLYLNIEYLTLNEKNICTIAKLSEQIHAIKLPEQNIVELLPPPIFDIEIILSPLADDLNGKEIEFNKLSSGEKQLVYSVSSILYHLSNLDSVSNNKIRYQNINIVLEEIELYFHPELQRKYVKYILDSIERLQLTFINSINFCFVTHSPFILSDIPSNNIMFLKVVDGVAKQVTEKKNTFGANIHEILGDSFFMEHGYIGTFAQEKIEKTIKWLSSNRLQKEEESQFRVNKEYHKKVISLIDEPILKIKLGEMYSELDDDKKFYNQLIDEQIEFLTNQRK